MNKIVGLTILLGVAVVGLLWWIGRDAQLGLEERQDLLENKGRNVKRAGTSRIRDDGPPLARSKSASQEILRVTLAEGDPRSLDGGSTVAFLAGNNVLIRRVNIDASSAERLVLTRAHADGLVRSVLELPADTPPADGQLLAAVTLDAGATTRRVSRDTVMELLNEMTGPRQDWIPKRIFATFTRCEGPPPKDAHPWPTGAGFPGPETFLGAGAELRGTESARRELLKILRPGRLVSLAEMCFRVESYACDVP